MEKKLKDSVNSSKEEKKDDRLFFNFVVKDAEEKEVERANEKYERNYKKMAESTTHYRNTAKIGLFDLR